MSRGSISVVYDAKNKIAVTRCYDNSVVTVTSTLAVTHRLQKVFSAKEKLAIDQPLVVLTNVAWAARMGHTKLYRVSIHRNSGRSSHECWTRPSSMPGYCTAWTFGEKAHEICSRPLEPQGVRPRLCEVSDVNCHLRISFLEISSITTQIVPTQLGPYSLSKI